MSEKAVLKTNQRFYDAFNKNDIELMVGSLVERFNFAVYSPGVGRPDWI